jgi:murein DD-endopeptidase MepM/ murein hydrolase activator NlpD
VNWRRRGARGLITAGLLLPSLLLMHPAGPHAEGKQGKLGPKRTASKEHTASKAARSVGSPPAGANDRCTHVVRRGDSVARIATQYRVTRQGLLSANHLAIPDVLKVGQRLTIPGCRAGKSPRRPAPVPAALELDTGLVLARVGPRRVPTRLFMTVPEFENGAVDFAWPVDGAILSAFGKRRAGWHAGIDIKAGQGTPILAAAAGTVVFSGWAASYGRTIKIQHDHGFISTYAHNHENLVKVGDEVAGGAMIATVGQTGRASTAHLHFEIRRDGMAYNPLHLLEMQDGATVLASAMAEPQDEDDDEPRE